jgi:hypothetical protein
LEEELRETAKALGISESEAIRRAVQGFCSVQQSGPTLYDELSPLFVRWAEEDADREAFDENLADGAHEAFGRLLVDEWRAKGLLDDAD